MMTVIVLVDSLLTLGSELCSLIMNQVKNKDIFFPALKFSKIVSVVHPLVQQDERHF